MHGLWISLVTWDVATDGELSCQPTGAARTCTVDTDISIVIILAMPVPLLWSLNLKFRDKVMLTCLFVLGAM